MTIRDTHFFDTLADTIYQANVLVGWWDDPDRCLFTTLQLVSTEVAEATEGVRKCLHDTHLPDRPMEEVEYADALIRTLDVGGKLKLSYDDDSVAHPWCIATNTVGHQQLGMNAAIVKMGEALYDFYHYGSGNEVYNVVLEQCYGDLIASIVTVSKNRDLLLFEAVEAKMEYNKTRADHKRENREKANGKKF
ncbi:MAG: hypothetical protein V3S69_05050 [Dehalococcoidales bacterium]